MVQPPRTLGASWDDVYESVDTVAPGAEGLMFLPYLTRERAHHRNPHSSGAFRGIWADSAATASVAPHTHVVAIPNTKQASAYDEVYARYLRLSGATDAST